MPKFDGILTFPPYLLLSLSFFMFFSIAFPRFFSYPDSLPSLFILKNAKISFIVDMKNYDLKEKQLQISDPIESYFECISSCDLKDGTCISRCVEILKHHEY